MKKSLLRSGFRLMLAIILLTGCLTTSVWAKYAPALSKEKVTMLPYDKLTVTLKYADGKVKWTTKNNIGVRVDSVTGKNNTKVVITSGSKTGSCTLTAKIGKNAYRCKVTVKSGMRAGGSYKGKSKSSLEKVIQKGKKLIVRVKLCNGSGKSACWADYMGLERRSRGKWKTVPYKRGFAGWDEVSAKTADLSPRSVTYVDYVLTDYFRQRDLISGTYRLQILPSYPDYGRQPQDFIVFRMHGWDE